MLRHDGFAIWSSVACNEATAEEMHKWLCKSHVEKDAAHKFNSPLVAKDIL